MKVAIHGVVAFTTIVVCSNGCVPRSSTPSLGFWYQTGSLTLPSAITTRLGGPLQTDESELIEQISRSEIENAFSDLGIHLTTNRDAFWRVEVVQSLPAGAVPQLPSAGRSLLLGPLGGRGAVGVDMVASKAIYYAPVDAPREHLIAGIGRGIGRVAVHEFFHQILALRPRTTTRTSTATNTEAPTGRLSTMAYCTGRRGCRFCAGDSARKVRRFPRLRRSRCCGRNE
jgi:hypothetical protein